MNNQKIKCKKPANGQADSPQMFLSLNEDELAAIEGWRASNNIPSLSDAVRELVRLGLLSEIAKVHSVVSAVRDTVER